LVSKVGVDQIDVPNRLFKHFIPHPNQQKFLDVSRHVDFEGDLISRVRIEKPFRFFADKVAQIPRYMLKEWVELHGKDRELYPHMTIELCTLLDQKVLEPLGKHIKVFYIPNGHKKQLLHM
jgi:hypothetical protein